LSLNLMNDDDYYVMIDNSSHHQFVAKWRIRKRYDFMWIIDI
jgi:hypothetical protein